MSICVLSANLGNFDQPQPLLKQSLDFDYHCFTDEDFPPIADWPPRLQYRLPKTHGWQMKPGYEFYVFMDGNMSFTDENSLAWLVGQMGELDMAFFKHPWRETVAEEVNHIEEYLQKGNKYITDRYQNGLHGDQPQSSPDAPVFYSGVFIYRNKPTVQKALKDWWYYQSRYYTCDQVNLTYALETNPVRIKTIDEDPFNCKYLNQGRHQ